MACMYAFQILVASVGIIFWSVLLVFAFRITYPGTANFFSGGGSFPAILCILIIVMNIWWIFNSIKMLRFFKTNNLLEENSSVEQKSRVREFIFGTKEQEKKLFIMMIITVIYVFALIPLFASFNRTFGFVVATAVFLIVSIKKFSNKGWIKTISISAATSIILFIVMNNILKLPMPK
jgi:uncharacterized integral membrane protein